MIVLRVYKRGRIIGKREAFISPYPETELLAEYILPSVTDEELRRPESINIDTLKPS